MLAVGFYTLSLDKNMNNFSCAIKLENACYDIIGVCFFVILLFAISYLLIIAKKRNWKD